jgi:Flp pilus assembly protein TadG
MKDVGLIKRLEISNDASTAVEFAMVLPLLLIFLLGIIDASRFMWTMNRVEKATQMGARMAAVTDMVPGGLYAKDFSETVGQGISVPTSSFGLAQCSKPSGTVTCSCDTNVGGCPTLTPYNSTAFNAIVTRMSLLAPVITEKEVTIRYANSGLGYAGNPNGPDVAPLITVTATGLKFVPLIFLFFGGSFTLPDISATLPMEDGAGTVSN